MLSEAVFLRGREGKRGYNLPKETANVGQFNYIDSFIVSRHAYKNRIKCKSPLFPNPIFDNLSFRKGDVVFTWKRQSIKNEPLNYEAKKFTRDSHCYCSFDTMSVKLFVKDIFDSESLYVYNNSSEFMEHIIPLGICNVNELFDYDRIKNDNWKTASISTIILGITTLDTERISDVGEDKNRLFDISDELEVFFPFFDNNSDKDSDKIVVWDGHRHVFNINWYKTWYLPHIPKRMWDQKRLGLLLRRKKRSLDPREEKIRVLREYLALTHFFMKKWNRDTLHPKLSEIVNIDNSTKLENMITLSSQLKYEIPTDLDFDNVEYQEIKQIQYGHLHHQPKSKVHMVVKKYIKELNRVDVRIDFLK
jgi:hypothetical protein